MSPDLFQAKISRNPKVAWQKIEDKIVAVHPEKRRIHIIYDSGVSIWEALAKPKRFEEIVDFILEDYEVGKNIVNKDVGNFLKVLKDKELISLEE
ncbi:MAG: hypothetical protein DRP80_07455 [Candidatus Omnitrophota bacterium]|nr:MAG: hypothetical protein DRP80_07455 [Candidatus Omnitrophota bacterium]